MSLLNKVYSLKLTNLTFEFVPRHKFNILLDKSGTGKTTLAREIAMSGYYSNMRYFASDPNISRITEKQDFLFIFDENDISQFISTHGIELLNKSPNVFLIITRDLLDFTSIDYLAIYTLHYDKSKEYYYVEPRYKPQKTFINNETLITEDSGFGLKYFNQFNSNTVTASGKTNVCKLIKENCTVIADGSAFAYEYNKCLKNHSKNVKYFLPDSFEGLVLENTQSAKSVVENSHKDEVLDYTSIEQYYTDKITLFYPGYTKALGHSSILNKDLLHLDKYSDKVIDYCKKTNLKFEDVVNSYKGLASESKCRELGITADIDKAYVALKALGKIVE